MEPQQLSARPPRRHPREPGQRPRLAPLQTSRACHVRRELQGGAQRGRQRATVGAAGRATSESSAVVLMRG